MISRPLASTAVFQLKATLRGSKPPIWRRFQVPANVTLHRLHLILQVVMGWSNYHLYSFEIEGTEYGEPHPDNDFYELDFKNSRTARLSGVARFQDLRFTYRYDFGDGWDHEIRVEKVVPAAAGTSYPVCVGGRRACPPEDCGGIEGYSELLRAVRNPRNREHDRMMEWLGGHFDPEAFDPNRVNVALRPRILLPPR